MASSVLILFFKSALGDYVVLAVLGVLLVMSVLSWALFFYKLIQLSSVAKRERSFYVLIESGAPFKSIFAKRLSREDVPFDVFLKLLLEESAVSTSAVDSAALVARTSLERGLGVIASITSTAPFVGLFGTVWGIMKAFHLIGLKGEASLAVVAPGISEALVNTALGLFVAIPAVFFYNYLSRRVDTIIDRFRAYGNLFVERYGRRDEKKSAF